MKYQRRAGHEVKTREWVSQKSGATGVLIKGSNGGCGCALLIMHSTASLTARD